MKTDYIIKRFKESGFTITCSMQTGRIVVKNRVGAAKTFVSYAQAYRFYFKAD